MIVGIKTKGKSNVRPVNGIELKSCITYKELAKCEIALIENCTKEDEEKVRDLVQKCKKVYSIGSIDAEISRITIPITNIAEIISEKTALMKEKEKNVEELKKADKKIRETKQKEFEISNENAELKKERAKLTRENEIKDGKIESLQNELNETKSMLEGEKEQREKLEKELDDFKGTLGNTIISNKMQMQETKDTLNKKHVKEIEEINLIIKNKDNEIDELKGKINNLTKQNKELSEKGAIPELVYKYKGDAKIITFIGQGSYGVSNLLYSVYKILQERKKNMLLVDFDFKGGNLNKYIGKNPSNIENWIKNGELFKQHIVKTLDNKLIDFVSGFENNIVKPSDIYTLDFDKLFEGNYEYILIDGGIYGGYNIQTKLVDMLMKNGNIVHVYIDKKIEEKSDKEKNNYVFNIKNFSRDNEGIPIQMQMYGTQKTLFENMLTKIIIEKECEQWLV